MVPVVLYELNDVYSSPIIVQVIKLRRMRWAWHVAHMGERRGVYRVLVGNLRERDHLGDQVVGGRIILRWIFKSGMWRYGLGRPG